MPKPDPTIKPDLKVQTTEANPPMDWPTYDRCLSEGRQEYLQGGGTNPYQHGTNEWDWWREGYDR